MALNISEKQVLVNFDDDPNFRWHARVLFLPLPEAGRWIGCSPDYEFQIIDLNVHKIKMLPKGVVDLPQDVRREGTYLFDDMAPGQLEQLRREAQEYSLVLGVVGASASSATSSSGKWRVSDTAHVGFGDEIPSMVTSDSTVFSQKELTAMAKIDEVWVSCQYVEDTKEGDWRRKKFCGTAHDFRLSGDPAIGIKWSFEQALDNSPPVKDSKDLPNWSLGAERVAYEYTSALKSAGYNFVTHHLDFASKSGISRNSSSCRTHRRLCEILALLFQADRLNIHNLQGCEFMMQYLYQLESAILKNPKAPDFSFMDEFLSVGINEAGGLILPKYGHFVAELQRDRAQALKQQRLWNEEQGWKNKGGGDDAKGKGKKGKKGKGTGADAWDDA